MAGKAAERLEVVHPDCAGIDVGKRKHYVAVDASRFEDPVRHFGSFTRDLEAMAEWLLGCGVAQVAMESTGVYWIPVFEVLDRAGFEVHLVNPRATKQVSGRKSDVLDCQWIRQLMSYGLLRGAFRAPDELCPMRSYVRQREPAHPRPQPRGAAPAKGADADERAVGQRAQRHHGQDRSTHRARHCGGRTRRRGAGSIPGPTVQGRSRGSCGEFARQLARRAPVCPGAGAGPPRHAARSNRGVRGAHRCRTGRTGRGRRGRVAVDAHRPRARPATPAATDARVRLDRDSHGRRGDRADGRCGTRRGPVALSPLPSTSARGWAWRRARASAATSAWADRQENRSTGSARRCAWRPAPPATARPPSARRIADACSAWTPRGRSKPPPINWPGSSTRCGPVARRMSSGTWRRWRRSAAIAKSNTFSAKPVTSTWHWCRPNKRLETESPSTKNQWVIVLFHASVRRMVGQSYLLGCWLEVTMNTYVVHKWQRYLSL